MEDSGWFALAGYYSECGARMPENRANLSGINPEAVTMVQTPSEERDYLPVLSAVAARVLGDPATTEKIQRLKSEIEAASEPFVWDTIEIAPYGDVLPRDILSAWIFVLKRNTRSIAHYHPNSVQHMAVISGSGYVEIGGRRSALRPFTPGDLNAWHVIGQNVSHELFPAEDDVVVLSFHTVAAADLIEIQTECARQRVYESS